MKITLHISRYEDNGAIHDIDIDGKDDERIKGLCDCPEDARIGRSLIDGFHLIEWFRKGWDAAKSGESCTIKIIEGTRETITQLT